MAKINRDIIRLTKGDDYGVYFTGWRDPETGLAIAYRGPLEECLKVRLVEKMSGGYVDTPNPICLVCDEEVEPDEQIICEDADGVEIGSIHMGICDMSFCQNPDRY